MKFWLGCLFVLLAAPSAVCSDFETALQKDCSSAICILADSGLTICEHNAEELRPPASMIKLMQILMVMEGIEAGQWSLDTIINVTEHAERMGGSQVYLGKDEEWKLSDLIGAVCVVSANDAAMAIAEGLWGSEEEYLKAMNVRAKELGMTLSEFHSVHGLPPDKGEQVDKTCARDMAILARHCVQYPLLMEWVGQKELTLREGDPVQYNTNKLLWRMEECDGLKTGYTNAAGWCLTSTAERDGIRLIVVVMGCKTSGSRFTLTEAIFQEGFQESERFRVLAKGDTVDPEISVQNCEKAVTRLAASEDVWVTVPKRSKAGLKLMTETPAELRPPLEPGETVGQLQVAFGDQILARTPLLLAEPLRPAPLRWKLVRTVLNR
ncbi:MAG TPA: D-alanyl-D-alanine carboxypeptidase family protein [Candidatus Hydrogenedentes bacterium]|nr:D-alanyl-D-alanine carboxypeptidase family protein [Candidatus Hydrogenedentota bacterium]